MSKSTIILLSILLSGVAFTSMNCSPSATGSKTRTNTTYFNFCDFPQHLNERVRIKAIYSGVDEYWGIHSMSKCNKQIGVDLSIDDIYDRLPKKIKKMFSEVHEKYWKYYLMIDAIGKFEMSAKQGYGHLGHNKATFITDSIISMELIEKKKS